MIKKLALLMLVLLPVMAFAQEPPDLPELYTSQDGSFQFSFPKNWWLEVGPNYVMIGSSEEALDVTPDFLKDGQGRAIFLPYTPDSLENLEGEANAASVAAALAEQFAEEQEVSEPEAVELAAGEAARVRWSTSDSEVTLLAVNVHEDIYIVAIIIAAHGELEKVEPTFIAIADTFNYRTPEEIEADETALVEKWEASERSLEDGTPYYLVVPEGDTPEGGWPVVVALADFEQNPGELLPFFADAANRRGVVFVAAGFGDYANRESNRAKLDELLAAVNEVIDVTDKGVVLYGFGEGGVLVTDYLEMDTEGVGGIIAEGARTLYAPPESRQDIPYGIIYGENDPNLNSVNEISIQEIQAMGYVVRAFRISGGDHVISNEGIKMVFDMVDLLHETTPQE